MVGDICVCVMVVVWVVRVVSSRECERDVGHGVSALLAPTTLCIDHKDRGDSGLAHKHTHNHGISPGEEEMSYVCKDRRVKFIQYV